MTIRHITKTDFCKGFCMGANKKMLRQVNNQYKQEHSMFYTQTSQHLVSRRHPHVAMRIRCFDIGNVPNPRSIWGESTSQDICLDSTTKSCLLGSKHLVLTSPSCEENFLTQSLMMSPADNGFGKGSC